MQNSRLTAWLDEHRETLAAAYGAALIDSVLETARTGRVDQLESDIQQAAHQAAIEEVPLDQLLRKPRHLKEAIWKQLRQDEMPVEQTLALIEATELIFSRLFQIATRSYFESGQQMQDALASEIARLSSEAERQVMDRTADLTRANIELTKLEQAKTDFISIAAHELKTPLTLIQGYANMMREMELDSKPATGATNVLAGILRGTERLGAIVEDMLDVSAIDTNALSLRIERTSLVHAVNLAVTQNAPHFKERDVAVHIDGLTDLPKVEVDPRRLHQILSHLLNNAMKYTPDGGEVFIEGRVLPGGGAVGGNPIGSGKFVELTFRDTGIGIAPEDRERVFEKFYRVGKSTLHSSGKVKFKGAGPGLGLPIAKGLVEAHGGRLWVESPGHDEVNCPGSTFYLLLPVLAVPKPGVTVTWTEQSAGEQSEQPGGS
jgi:signal transduction histidine kinase